MSKLLRQLLAGLYLGMPHIVEEGAGGGASDDGEGADNGTNGEVVGTGNDKRLAFMDQIADANDESRADELANVNDDDTTEPFKVEKAKTEEETIEEELPLDNPNPTEKPETRKYKIKVNGKELELSEEELIARAQKVESADEYLRTAKQQAAPKPTPEAPKGPSAEEAQRQEAEELLLAARAIQMGSEEEAVAALRKVVQKASSARPSFTPDDVSRTIDERLAFNTAINDFSEKYEDIWTDPTLKSLAFQRDAQLLKEGDARPYAERYAAVGEEIRTWKASLIASAAPKAEEKTEEQTKLERKASAPKAPVAASAKAKPAPQEEEVDDSPSAVIANMAKTRGGPQWMRN
jgi:hypothetical protein